MIRRAATNRVLNVLRHWVSKHSQVGGAGTGPQEPASREAGGGPQGHQGTGAWVSPPPSTAGLPSGSWPRGAATGEKEDEAETARAGQGPLQAARALWPAPWPCLPPQDFETNEELRCRVISFLEEVMHDPELLTQERKAAANIIR